MHAIHSVRKNNADGRHLDGSFDATRISPGDTAVLMTISLISTPRAPLDTPDIHDGAFVHSIINARESLSSRKTPDENITNSTRTAD